MLQRVVLLIAAMLAISARTNAQRIDVGLLILATDHELLRGALVGPSLDVRIHGQDQTGAYLGIDYVRGTSDRDGIACAGLLEPGTCPPERVRDFSTVSTIRGGVSSRILYRGSLVVEAGGDGTLSWVASKSQGLASGRALSANKTLVGAFVTVTGLWTPRAQWPLALAIGGEVGGVAPAHNELQVDGYTPFEERFSIRRLRIGLAWRRDRPWNARAHSVSHE